MTPGFYSTRMKGVLPCRIYTKYFDSYSKYSDTFTPYEICLRILPSASEYLLMDLNTARRVENSVGPGQTAVSDLGLL